jgi:starch synthase
MDPCVVVSQPVRLHAYEAAVAAGRAGLLHTFTTGMYRTGRGLWGPSAWWWAPAPLRQAVDRRLRRRWHPALDPARVHPISRYHLLAAAWRSLITVPAPSPWDVEQWAHRRFDAAVARLVPRLPGVRLLHAFEGAALATFQVARGLGLPTLLDVPAALEPTIAALTAEGAPTAHFPVARVRAERALATYLLAPSPFVVECLRRAGVPAERIVPLPYGVDTTRFCPAPVFGAEQTERRPDGVFRALFVGRIGPRKGVRYLLEAWQRLALPHAELVLVGAAEREGRALLRRYAGRSRWLRAVPYTEVHRVYASADVFVFPSLAEGSAWVTYEAMAAGLPVVTTPTSGAVLRHGVEGLIVPPRDVEALAAAIELLYRSPAMRRHMGRAGRRLMERSYTWQHYHARLARVYTAILAGADPRAAVAEPVTVEVVRDEPSAW